MIVTVSPSDIELGEEFLHPNMVDQLWDEGQGIAVVDCPFI